MQKKIQNLVSTTTKSGEKLNINETRMLQNGNVKEI